MKHHIIRRALPLLLCLALALTLASTAAAAPARDTQALVSVSAEYMLSAVKSPQVGSIGGEWAVIGLARSGYEVPDEYYQSYYSCVEEYVTACKGVLHEKKYTEYSRVVLALTAIGKDPSDVAGYNLLTPLGDYEKTVWQGINGPVWALIALDSGSYAMPQNPAAATQATRQLYVQAILDSELPGGGWNLTGEGGADPDMTAMALQALAKYLSQSAVQSAAERALAWLSSAQSDSGGFASWGTVNSESAAQVIVALTELGVSLDDGRFTKNGVTLLDNLLSFRLPSGGFLHTAAVSGNNQMASEQGFYALVAALRAAGGKNSLYRMSDAIRTGEHTGPVRGEGLPGKNADVSAPAIAFPGRTFDDIAFSENIAAIEALAARGIIDGKADGAFEPDAHMTRAEFAAIVTRSLGLPVGESRDFDDVAPGSWYAPYVGAACKYGIVDGVDVGVFDPNGTITRQQAAAMVARAARLCGMDTALETYEILNILAQFGDYITISDWARESLAFCCGADILSQSDLNVRPLAPILRCEIAQMLYNLLASANLI